MKHLLFLLAMCATTLHAEPQSTPPLHWETSLKAAEQLSQSSHLPIYLVFSGSSWCIWCQRMDQEIHSQKAFIDKMQGKCIFVSIDIPAGGQMDTATQQLFSQYKIRGLPTAIALSPDLKELGRFGYTHIRPDQYADMLLETFTLTK